MEKKKEKPGFVKLYEKEKEKEKQDLIKQLNVRDRLLRRVQHQTVKIPFKDDLGEFNITCRLFSEAEMRKLIDLQNRLGRIRKGEEEYDIIMKQLRELLAYPEGICCESMLDLDFWRKGNYSFNDMVKIVVEVSKKTSVIIDETSSFRKK